MADTDRARMLELGQWLQDYLNPGITAKGYRKLAQGFIKLYNVDFKISSHDVTLRVFELMDKSDLQAEKYKKFFVEHIGNFVDRVMGTIVKYSEKENPSFENLCHRYPYPEGKEIFDEIKKTVFQYEPTTPENDFQEFGVFYYEWGIYCLSIVSNAIQIKGETESILHEVLTSSGSWKKTLAAKIENEKYLFKTPPLYLHLSYNCLAENLLVKTDNIKKHMVFSGGYAQSYSCDMTPSVFPWEAAVSRILFDFLFTGGQDHFKFCEYCGAFTVIRRKGSKKFCSDLCRAHHRFDEIAKSQ